MTPRMARSSHYNVAAVYSDLVGARKGIEALEGSGIDPADISMEGDAAREAAGAGDTAPRDQAFLQRVRNNTLIGIFFGALFGVGLGAIIAILAFGPPGSETFRFDGLIGMCLALGLFGTGMGFLTTNIGRSMQSQAWEETLGEVAEGAVIVAAHTNSEGVFQRAVSALEGTQPQQLDRFDNHGNPLPVG